LHSGTAHIAFDTGGTASASVIFRTFAAQYPTPHNCCVRFVATVAGGPRNTRYRAGASPYPDRTCTGWIRSAYPDAPPPEAMGGRQGDGTIAAVMTANGVSDVSN